MLPASHCALKVPSMHVKQKAMLTYHWHVCATSHMQIVKHGNIWGRKVIFGRYLSYPCVLASNLKNRFAKCSFYFWVDDGLWFDTCDASSTLRFADIRSHSVAGQIRIDNSVSNNVPWKTQSLLSWPQITSRTWDHRLSKNENCILQVNSSRRTLSPPMRIFPWVKTKSFLKQKLKY